MKLFAPASFPDFPISDSFLNLFSLFVFFFYSDGCQHQGVPSPCGRLCEHDWDADEWLPGYLWSHREFRWALISPASCSLLMYSQGNMCSLQPESASILISAVSLSPISSSRIPSARPYYLPRCRASNHTLISHSTYCIWSLLKLINLSYTVATVKFTLWITCWDLCDYFGSVNSHTLTGLSGKLVLWSDTYETKMSVAPFASLHSVHSLIKHSLEKNV